MRRKLLADAPHKKSGKYSPVFLYIWGNQANTTHALADKYIHNECIYCRQSDGEHYTKCQTFKPYHNLISCGPETYLRQVNVQHSRQLVWILAHSGARGASNLWQASYTHPQIARPGVPIGRGIQLPLSCVNNREGSE
jgi:hypothetical protein